MWRYYRVFHGSSNIWREFILRRRERERERVGGKKKMKSNSQVSKR